MIKQMAQSIKNPQNKSIINTHTLTHAQTFIPPTHREKSKLNTSWKWFKNRSF